jgi:hypothetical protein
MIEFIGALYNLSQQFRHHYLTHCHLLRLDTLCQTELLNYSIQRHLLFYSLGTDSIENMSIA